MPPNVRELILQFLYSFDASTFMNRLLKVQQLVDMRAFCPKFAIAQVPGARALRAELKHERAVKRHEERKRSLKRSRSLPHKVAQPMWL